MSDDKIKDILQAGLDAALKSHVELLFGVLMKGGEFEHAVNGAKQGIEAYRQGCKALEKSDIVT